LRGPFFLAAAFAALALAAQAAAELPRYQPEAKVSGVIRNYGFGFGGLLKIWEEGFREHHPDARFSDTLITSDAAFPALVTGVTDLAPDGGEPALTEWLSFYETYGYHATEIIVASGTYDVEGKSPGIVVYVHPENPLSRLTLAQLDGVFGSERTGGLDGFKWNLKAGRGPERNIRTWGELGLTGEWAGKAIQTYGHAPSGTTRFFQLKVLGNGDKWNPNYREYVETDSKMIAADDREQHGGLQHMLRDELARDRYGIAWTIVPQASKVAGLKPLALAAKEGGPYIVPSKESFQDRSYPLVRSLYFYLNRRPGTPVDPKLREFLRYVLSREGQEAIVRNANYLPLPPEMAREQLQKLDSPALPDYRAQAQVTGAIRTWGHGSRKKDFIGSLVKSWETGFRKHQPGIAFDTSLLGASSAIGGLYTGAADIALMERGLSAIEKDACEQVFGRDPVEVAVATGSLDVPDHAPALAIFVHRDNPLAKLTLAEVDAIFGADHRRGPDNIRTWGELGVGGEWADKAINAYVPGIAQEPSQYFQQAVMGGSQKWTGNLREFGDGRQVLDALAKDRYGIALATLVDRGTHVKPLALAMTHTSPYYSPARETVALRQYPLTRTVSVFVNRAPGEPLELKVREYLRYLLSKQGQEDIARDGGYLPLTAELAEQERRKVE
jgi:phosphate transport system substrate-binding protein